MKGRAVLDLGAFLGETALYFMQKGARRVVAVEPMATFEWIQKNADENGFTNSIIPVRGYVGPKFEGIDAGELNNSISTVKPGSEKIRHFTLKELIAEYDISQGSVLKIDVEGAEHEFFATAKDEELALFHQVFGEIHTIPGRDKDAPANRLKALGFDVSMEKNGRDMWVLDARRKD